MGVLAVWGCHGGPRSLVVDGCLTYGCLGCVVLGCNVCTLVPILGQRRGQIAAPKKIDASVL